MSLLAWLLLELQLPLLLEKLFNGRPFQRTKPKRHNVQLFGWLYVEQADQQLQDQLRHKVFGWNQPKRLFLCVPEWVLLEFIDHVLLEKLFSIQELRQSPSIICLVRMHSWLWLGPFQRIMLQILFWVFTLHRLERRRRQLVPVRSFLSMELLGGSLRIELLEDEQRYQYGHAWLKLLLRHWIPVELGYRFLQNRLR